MAKRIKCEIGNVIMIPVAKDLYGIARVVNIVSDTCLFEMYITKPHRLEDEINLENTMKSKKVYLWGYNDFIKKGRFIIIANIVPTHEIEMPYFIDTDTYPDTHEVKIYLQIGDFNEPLKGIGEKIFISEEKMRECMRDGITSNGIAFPYAIEAIFRKRMIYSNLLSEDSPKFPDYISERELKEKAEFKPFIFFRDDDGIYTITLEADGEYRQQIFDEFKDNGWLGNGTDWESLAMYYLENNMNEALEQIEFDSEAGMFVAYSKKCRIFKKFLKGFKEACENDEIMREMLKNTEPM